jgi:hypothetical protein
VGSSRVAGISESARREIAEHRAEATRCRSTAARFSDRFCAIGRAAGRLALAKPAPRPYTAPHSVLQ